MPIILATLAVAIGMGYAVGNSGKNDAVEKSKAEAVAMVNAEHKKAQDFINKEIPKAREEGRKEGVEETKNNSQNFLEKKVETKVEAKKDVVENNIETKAEAVPIDSITTNVSNLEYADNSTDNTVKNPTQSQIKNNLGNLKDAKTGQFLGFTDPAFGLRALLNQIERDKGIGGQVAKNGNTGETTLQDYIKKYTDNINGDPKNNKELKGYLDVVTKTTGKSIDIKIKDIDTQKLAEAITKAEGSLYVYNSDAKRLEYNKNYKTLASLPQIQKTFLASVFTPNYYKINPISKLDYSGVTAVA